jgi:hypothetical protein
VHFQIEKFTVGSLLGLVMPISLAWAQYVHPLNFPRMPQLEQIPSDYLFNIPLENALEELEQDSEWIELKEEAFHSDYEMQSTNLNDLNNSFEDFRMSDEFKKAKISISSNQLEKPILKPSSKSSDLELDHNFALTNLIKSSLQHTTTTPINNPVDIDWIESSHQEDISGKIETYPSHPSIFNRNSSVKYIENHGITSGKAGDKRPSATLSYNEVLTSYPVYSGIISKVSHPFFNIFDQSFADRSISTSETRQALPNEPILLTSRQRRVDFDSTATYIWEIEDFSTFDSFDFGTVDTTSGNTFNIYIYPTSGKNTGNDGFDFNSANQKTMAGVISGYDTIQTGKLFMTESVTGGSPLTFNIDDSLWQYVHMDWASETSWSVSNSGNDYYLNYDPNGFKLSAVPEPSTYFMTGALFCLIGCNRTSRNTLKIFLSKVFMHWKTKVNTEDVQDRIS